MKCDAYNVKTYTTYNAFEKPGLNIERHECWATKEHEECTCGGDQAKCTFSS